GAKPPEGRPERKPNPGDPKRPRPGQPKPSEPQPDGPEQPKPNAPTAEASEKAALPDIVKQHFLARPGYINYFFNQLSQDRVWKAFTSRGDFTQLAGNWTVQGELLAGGDFQLELSDQSSLIELPGGRAMVGMQGDLAASLDPPGSGGLLVTLGLWRRMLKDGPLKFGDVYYLGTAPLVGHDGLFDVLVATHNSVASQLYFDPANGQLAAWEM